MHVNSSGAATTSRPVVTPTSHRLPEKASSGQMFFDELLRKGSLAARETAPGGIRDLVQYLRLGCEVSRGDLTEKGMKGVKCSFMLEPNFQDGKDACPSVVGSVHFEVHGKSVVPIDVKSPMRFAGRKPSCGEPIPQLELLREFVSIANSEGIPIIRMPSDEHRISSYNGRFTRGEAQAARPAATAMWLFVQGLIRHSAEAK